MYNKILYFLYSAFRRALLKRVLKFYTIKRKSTNFCKYGAITRDERLIPLKARRQNSISTTDNPQKMIADQIAECRTIEFNGGLKYFCFWCHGMLVVILYTERKIATAMESALTDRLVDSYFVCAICSLLCKVLFIFCPCHHHICSYDQVSSDHSSNTAPTEHVIIFLEDKIEKKIESRKW